jgi:outer membrane protein assembly factor BamB
MNTDQNKEEINMNRARCLPAPSYFFVLLICVHLCSSVASSTASAANWPGWRGADGSGVSPEKGLPAKWSATQNVRWKVPLDGAGVSAPIVWEDHLFVTASDGRLNDRLHVYCYHRDDGRLLWHTRLFGSAAPEGQFALGGMAVPTPATDGKRVYALFGTGDLVCLDFDGKPLWVRSLAQEHGPFRNRWGMAASPILVDDLLLVQVDHWGQSYLLCLDAAAGVDRWCTPRDASVNWTSPVVATVQGERQVIVAGTYKVKGYDLARGHEVWSVTGLVMQCIATPVVQGDMLYVLCGSGLSTLAIRLNGDKGDLTKTHVAWTAKCGAEIPSALVLGEQYCYVEDNGFANCRSAATGARVWRERLGGGKYQASPVASADKIYFASTEGLVTVIERGPRFKVLARNNIGEAIVAAPALSNGRIFLRGEKHLFCIEDSGK